MRIKIFCRSFDLRLYERSRAFYESAGLPVVRLTDQTADGYFYTMLADMDCDVAINIDEDCFVADMPAVLRLAEYVVSRGYANAGCPDGGGATPRNASPVVTNPFFNILNLKLVRSRVGDAAAVRREVRHFDIPAHLPALKAKTEALRASQGVADGYHPDNGYALKDTEPYYPFFLWLADRFDTLYLPSAKHPDGWTTLLYMPEDVDGTHTLLCAHSWLARFYSVPGFVVRHWQHNAGRQKARIDALIQETARTAGVTISRDTFGDNCRYAADKLLRWLIKVPQRMLNWPAKLRKKLGR